MRWFIADHGADRPDYLPPGGGRSVLDGKPGIVVAGIIRPGETSETWHRLPCGALFHVEQSSQPRLRAARPEEETIIEDGDRKWNVPTLLRPSETGLVCALPCIWTLSGFKVPEFCAELVSDLMGFATSPQTQSDEAGALLACRILSVSYHLSMHEISAGQWLTSRAIERIILAACGLEWRQVGG